MARLIGALWVRWLRRGRAVNESRPRRLSVILFDEIEGAPRSETRCSRSWLRR